MTMDLAPPFACDAWLRVPRDVDCERERERDDDGRERVGVPPFFERLPPLDRVLLREPDFAFVVDPRERLELSGDITLSPFECVPARSRPPTRLQAEYTHYDPARVSQTFAAERPDLRGLPRWHRLAYITRALPKAVEDLAQDLPPADRVLDYGCADLPYRGLFRPDADYIAADLPGNPRATVAIAPDGTLSVDDATCDVVVSTQVLEHVADPTTYLRECARVLRPGGRLLLTTHGVMVWHPDPVDYWRWTCEGLRRAIAQAGLEIRRFEGVMGLAPTGLQLFQDAVLAKLPRAAQAPFALFMQTLIAAADRLHSADSKRLNALVFALTAEKPQ
jgi:SAM-dependent methyltransferase